jgi:nucleoporin SEH1
MPLSSTVLGNTFSSTDSLPSVGWSASPATDIVYDIAYDYYGRRVATCSSDQVVRVFEGEDGHKVAEWRAHSGAIWRIAWAHPEFGVALATCSFDRRICVWEEGTDAEEAALAAAGGAGGSVPGWPKRAELVDARDSVADIAFAPHHAGLRLASCGADGAVRVHDAPDVLDLGSWELQCEFDAVTGGRLGTPPEGGGRAANAAASGGGGATAAAAAAEGGEPLCLAWCPCIGEPPMLVVGLSDGCVALWVSGVAGWVRSRAFGPGAAHLGAVRGVAWAPDVGRSHEVIATASSDKTTKLWNLTSAGGGYGGGEGEGEGGQAGGADGWSAVPCATLPHRSQVWRVSWNASGSLLASSEDDGTVRVFKMDPSGEWQQAKATGGRV